MLNKEMMDILAEAPMCFIASLDNGAPRTRAFQFQFEQEGKLWFCTANTKKVYKQLQADPTVEICAVRPNMTWVRLSGQVVLADDRAVKERILQEQELIRGIYGDAGNPVFATFYLEHGAYQIADFSGNPPRTGSF